MPGVQGVVVSARERLAWLHGEPLHLTDTEFDLLYALITNAGRVVSREQLMTDIWTSASPTSKTLDMCLGQLRRKLGDDPKNPRFITRVRGRGLRFEREPSPRAAAGIEVDPDARRVWHNGEEVHLRAKEFDLLWLLARNAGKLVPLEQIMQEIWASPFWMSTKTLDVHLGWLRRKLGDDPKNPRFITRVRGQGLRFETPPNPRADGGPPHV